MSIFKIVLTLWILLLVFTIIGVVYDNKQRNNACKDIGFDNYDYGEEVDFCEDENYNLHYIHMECKPWYWVECVATEISVGDVRVV